MIKEIFDIEPKQKNSFLIFLAILPLTFLQLYLFKPQLLDKGTFIVIGICLALSVCWYIVSIIPALIFFNATANKEEKQDVRVESVLIICGLLSIAWIILLTYIAYELASNYKNFIRGSILIIILRCIFWLVIGRIRNSKES
jgi:hypothetical protein